ncbi:MAG: MarR family transcriptional regulator [Chloroflexota bacterium]|nr:MarR family transcriptional regulator [Chloroflexota bacterium]
MEDEQAVMAEQYFVEQAGIIIEHLGLPRMAGRVLGWLLICDPPHQSPGELAIALQASKASISTTIRLLMQVSLVERMVLPGKRRDYFRIRADTWSSATEERMGLITSMRELAEDGLALRTDAGMEATERLRDMRDFYAFYERELPALVARWRQERGKEQR